MRKITRWKALQYEFLVALDRPKDLAKQLQAWIAAGDADNGWRLILGYLDAESGQIPAAIRLFEAVRAADELRGADYRTLADWYMAVNRREAYDRARIETFKVIERMAAQPMALREVAALAAVATPSNRRPASWTWKSCSPLRPCLRSPSQPQNYLDQLQQFYAATRDFRLLAGLGDAVLGHTAGQVYPFLQGIVGRARRGSRRGHGRFDRRAHRRRPPRAKTEVDRRALDLLEMLVERRAAELQNQPGPHVEKALAAMRRAWKRAMVGRRTAAHGRAAGFAGPYRPAAAGR